MLGVSLTYPLEAGGWWLLYGGILSYTWRVSLPYQLLIKEQNMNKQKTKTITPYGGVSSLKKKKKRF